MIRAAVLAALLLLAATPADATAPRPAPDPTALLHPVEVPGADGPDRTRTGAPPERRAMGETGPSITASSHGQALASHPAILPTPSPELGTASWYGGSRGWHGVPHVALPSGRWTGEIGAHAVVCVFAGGRSRCATLPVVDCLCGGIPGRIVDLSIEAVALLGLEPSRGIWRASVEVIRRRGTHPGRDPGQPRRRDAGRAPGG